MKAIWNQQVIAESDATVVVEGNHYFPPSSIRKEFFKESPHHTVCPWKGRASYYHVEVGGKTNVNAAWYYPKTSDAARNIEGYVSFWNGVQITP